MQRYSRSVATLRVCSLLALLVIAAAGAVADVQKQLSVDKIGVKNLLQQLPTKPEDVRMRTKRSSQHVVTDCIHMTSDEGQFFRRVTELDGSACGIYIFAEPDKRIEVHFNYLDVACKNGGLLSFVDGWELNGQFFPSPEDHPKPMSERFTEFCDDQKKSKRIFLSSQNVALVQYRLPERTSGFSMSVKFVKNPTPCNVLLQSNEDMFTLRNYGKRSNCSIKALFPAVVKVASLSVGVVSNNGYGIELETGTLHKCQKRGIDDYVQIGGSSGLDNREMVLADSICGMDSKAGGHAELIACGTTTIRLVSSGGFDNSVTVVMRQLAEEDVSSYMSIICPPEGLLE